MSKFNFIIMLLFFTASLFAQKQTIGGMYCYNDNLNNADLNKFKPITVRVNAIILHQDDGSGTYKLLGSDEKSIDESSTLMEYLDRTNYIYSHLIEPDSFNNCNYSGDEFFTDAKIRISNNVIPISDSYYYDIINGWGVNAYNISILNGINPSQTTPEGFYLQPLDDIIHSSSNYPKAINTYYPGDTELFNQAVLDNGATQAPKEFAVSHGPTISDLNRSSRTLVPNRYVKFLAHKYQVPDQYGVTWETARGWHINDARGGVAHELGHSFGLYHLNDCDDNIMKQRRGSNVKIAQNFFTPTQIRTMHNNFTNTNLIQFITEDSYYKVGLKITQNQTWTQKKRIYSDLIIENGATLTLKKDLIMSPQSKIYIRNGGKLILDGGIILSADNANWGGLFVNSTGIFQITSNTDSNLLYSNSYFTVTNNPNNSTICNDLINSQEDSKNEFKEINISPNPSSGIITIDLSNSEFINGELIIFDQSKNQILSERDLSENMVINLNTVPKGIYHVVFQKGNNKKSKQLIIK